jgi:hypothetical protein
VVTIILSLELAATTCCPPAEGTSLRRRSLVIG